MLQGERLVLFALSKKYLPYLLKWYNDLEVTQFLTLYLPMTEIGEEKWIEEICTTRQNSDVVFVICVIDGEKFIPIGNCGIHRINWKDRDADAGMAIGEKDYWSKGYGTEALELLVRYAFEQLNLHRLSAGAYSFNDRSLGMQKKVGFMREGRIRSAVYRKAPNEEFAKYHDKILSGLLKEKWLAKNKK